MGKKDPEVLREVLSRAEPFVTSDFRIVTDHEDSIIEPNCGVIVVRTNDSARPLTIQRITQLIRTFKDRFPDWHKQSWSNLYLEIFDHYVCIGGLTNAGSVRLKFFGLGDVDFAEALRSHISEIKVSLLEDGGRGR